MLVYKGVNKLFCMWKMLFCIGHTVFEEMLVFLYDRKWPNKKGFRSIIWGFFFLYGRFRSYHVRTCILLLITNILYGRKRSYKGGKNPYSDNFLLFWGGFAVILPTFSCEMRVNFIYMTLFNQNRGGLKQEHGTSKSICIW